MNESLLFSSLCLFVFFYISKNNLMGFTLGSTFMIMFPSFAVKLQNRNYVFYFCGKWCLAKQERLDSFECSL